MSEDELHSITQGGKIRKAMTNARFEPRPTMLNHIEIRRIRRKVEDMTASLFH
jgi:hypothetical protein